MSRGGHAFRFTAEKIAARIDLLRSVVNRRSVPLPPFRLFEMNGPGEAPPLDADPADWPEIAALTHWGRFDLNFLLRGSFAVPEGWTEPALHLPMGNSGDIFTHPEALLHVDGRTLASVDRYHHTLPLPPEFSDGRTRQIALHGWTGLSGWPPDPEDRRQLFMGRCCVIERDMGALALARAMEAALEVARHLDAAHPARHGLTAALEAAALALDTRDPLGDALRESAPRAQEVLDDMLSRADKPMEVDLHAIGHAHIDIAYLWTIPQGRRKAVRTFANVLRLMDAEPLFTFTQSQPQLYAFAEEDDPALFERIRARVAEGRWEVTGGMWVEPDVNLAGAESLVRQLLLGCTFLEDRFGTIGTPCLFLPDTFGFPAQLPQLMRQAGLEYFVTNKLSWNQYNSMPDQTFRWQGLDGSEVLAQMLTTPRPVRHLPFPASYKSELTASEVFGTWERYAQKEANRHLPICYGYGDGGGGPTEELIGRAKALAAMPGAPRLGLSRLGDLFEALDGNWPVWRGELYMEGHRGVFTSQGWIKRANRRAEGALARAELLICHAALSGHRPDRDALRRAWELLCLHQFHDILTGTAIREVFEEARESYARIHGIAEEEASRAIAALGRPEPAVLNPAPYLWSGPVLTEEDVPGGQRVEGGTLVDPGPVAPHAIVPLRHVPSDHPPVRACLAAGGAAIRNGLLAAELDATGRIARLTDLEHGREVLAPGGLGNALTVFEDRPVAWDAWDIDVFFEDRPDPVTDLRRMDVEEDGPLRASLLLEWRHRGSTIRQRMRLAAGSRRLEFHTEIDWRESHALLKAAFPVLVDAPNATFDIQWGTVERPTHRNTPWDRARFEVPANEWADLSESGYGAALLSDSRHGFDVCGNVMRLSLVKSATMPDPQADRGLHRLAYAILPHAGDWREGRVDAEARAFCRPAEVLGARPRPALATCDAPWAVIETVKPAEDGDGLILRLHENERRRGPVRLDLSFDVRGAERCDLLERPAAGAPPRVEGRTIRLDLAPYEIVSLRLRPM